jgi:ankyrin repeat protein
LLENFGQLRLGKKSENLHQIVKLISFNQVDKLADVAQKTKLTLRAKKRQSVIPTMIPDMLPLAFYKMIDVNERKQSDGVSSAFIAVKHDNLDMLKMLVKSGADLDGLFRVGDLRLKLLHVACSHASQSMVSYLLAREEDEI